MDEDEQSSIYGVRTKIEPFVKENFQWEIQNFDSFYHSDTTLQQRFGPFDDGKVDLLIELALLNKTFDEDEDYFRDDGKDLKIDIKFLRGSVVAVGKRQLRFFMKILPDWKLNFALDLYCVSTTVRHVPTSVLSPDCTLFLDMQYSTKQYKIVGSVIPERFSGLIGLNGGQGASQGGVKIEEIQGDGQDEVEENGQNEVEDLNEAPSSSSNPIINFSSNIASNSSEDLSTIRGSPTPSPIPPPNSFLPLDLLQHIDKLVEFDFDNNEPTLHQKFSNRAELAMYEKSQEFSQLFDEIKAGNCSDLDAFSKAHSHLYTSLQNAFQIINDTWEFKPSAQIKRVDMGKILKRISEYRDFVDFMEIGGQMEERLEKFEKEDKECYEQAKKWLQDPKDTIVEIRKHTEAFLEFQWLKQQMQSLWSMKNNDSKVDVSELTSSIESKLNDLKEKMDQYEEHQDALLIRPINSNLKLMKQNFALHSMVLKKMPSMVANEEKQVHRGGGWASSGFKMKSNLGQKDEKVKIVLGQKEEEIQKSTSSSKIGVVFEELSQKVKKSVSFSDLKDQQKDETSDLGQQKDESLDLKDQQKFEPSNLGQQKFEPSNLGQQKDETSGLKGQQKFETSDLKGQQKLKTSSTLDQQKFETSNLKSQQKIETSNLKGQQKLKTSSTLDQQKSTESPTLIQEKVKRSNLPTNELSQKTPKLPNEEKPASKFQLPPEPFIPISNKFSNLPSLSDENRKLNHEENEESMKPSKNKDINKSSLTNPAQKSTEPSKIENINKSSLTNPAQKSADPSKIENINKSSLTNPKNEDIKKPTPKPSESNKKSLPRQKSDASDSSTTSNNSKNSKPPFDLIKPIIREEDLDDEDFKLLTQKLLSLLHPIASSNQKSTMSYTDSQLSDLAEAFRLMYKQLQILFSMVNVSFVVEPKTELDNRARLNFAPKVPIKIVIILHYMSRLIRLVDPDAGTKSVNVWTNKSFAKFSGNEKSDYEKLRKWVVKCSQIKDYSYLTPHFQKHGEIILAFKHLEQQIIMFWFINKHHVMRNGNNLAGIALSFQPMFNEVREKLEILKGHYDELSFRPLAISLEILEESIDTLTSTVNLMGQFNEKGKKNYVKSLNENDRLYLCPKPFMYTKKSNELECDPGKYEKLSDLVQFRYELERVTLVLDNEFESNSDELYEALKELLEITKKLMDECKELESEWPLLFKIMKDHYKELNGRLKQRQKLKQTPKKSTDKPESSGTTNSSFIEQHLTPEKFFQFVNTLPEVDNKLIRSQAEITDIQMELYNAKHPQPDDFYIQLKRRLRKFNNIIDEYERGGASPDFVLIFKHILQEAVSEVEEKRSEAINRQRYPTLFYEYDSILELFQQIEQKLQTGSKLKELTDYISMILMPAINHFDFQIGEKKANDNSGIISLRNKLLSKVANLFAILDALKLESAETSTTDQSSDKKKNNKKK